jgi:hypothetical protein
MAQGMENDVSDDDSDSPSYDELLDLVHEHQRVIKKQSQKCSALNDLNATLATNYDDLLRKFQLLGKEHKELKLKIESITKINDSLETKRSNSCINLIDESNPYNEKCFEDVIVESCDDLIAKENDELKQEVQRLMKYLARLKRKSIESNVQPSQDNRMTW